MMRCVCGNAQKVPASGPSALVVQHGQPVSSAGPTVVDPAYQHITAFHEAAHAVFIEIAGWKVFRATVVPTASYFGKVWYLPRRFGLGWLEKNALISMSGPIAQSLVEQDIDPSRSPSRFNCSAEPETDRITRSMYAARPLSTCGHDRCRTLHCLLFRRHHASPSSLKLDYERAGRTALHILADDLVWATVLRIGDRLAARKTMEGDEISALIPPELGQRTLGDLARNLVSPLRASLDCWPVTYPPASSILYLNEAI